MNYENFVSAVEGLALKYQRMNSDMCVSVNRTDYGLELTCMLKEQMRDNWVEQMLAEIEEEYPNTEIILSDATRKIMVVQFEDYYGDYGFGIAKCSPTDEFNADVGMAVAFAHFCEEAVPDFV